MKSEIVSVGTELLLGQITDTNASYLAQRLSPLGIDLYYISQVGDNQARLVEVLGRAWGRSDLVIVTGGLGPTEDDLTREAIAQLLGEAMGVDPGLERNLREFFARRGVPMPSRNIKQATLIPSAQAIPNPIGTAPGWWVERQGRTVVAMPGVPHEMRRMWENEVEPRLRQRSGGAVIFSKTLKVIGLGESAAEEMVQSLLASANPTLATYAKLDGIHFRLTAKAADQAAAEALVADLEAQVRAVMGHYIYGVNDETLAGVIGTMLAEKGLTLATMESCTGGLLASTITDTPGSSAFFKGGLVAYSRQAKVACGVDPRALAEHGPASPPAAEAMARAARRCLDAALGLAITGAAGPAPADGTPAGTIHTALDYGGQITLHSSLHTTVRNEVKRRAVLGALNMLRLALLEARK